MSICYFLELNRDDKYMYGGSRSPEPYVPEEKKTKFDYSPQFTVTLRPRVVIEGATARFSCSVTGIPNPDVTWSRGPVQLDNAGRFISVVCMPAISTYEYETFYILFLRVFYIPYGCVPLIGIGLVTTVWWWFYYYSSVSM